MTANWLRDVRDLALSGRLRAIGGRKVLPVPIPAVIAQTIAASPIAKRARIKIAFTGCARIDLDSDEVEAAVARTITGACTRRQPRKSDMGSFATGANQHQVLPCPLCPESDRQPFPSHMSLWAMCGRLQVGKENLHVAGLVGAAMCSAFECGSHDRWP